MFGRGGLVAAAVAVATSLGCSADEAAETPRFESYIRADRYARLLLEVDYVDGFAPRDWVLGELGTGLEAILNKPAGVEAVKDDALGPYGTAKVWSDAALGQLGAALRSVTPPADTIAIHVLYLDGSYGTAGGDVLGLALGDLETIAIFAETLASVSAAIQVPPALAEKLYRLVELAVLTHEVGHQLGLVNRGLAMQSAHEEPDPGHARHCVDEACVMYWGVGAENVGEIIRQRLVQGEEASLGFDDACLADIAALRDR
jgi:hypothetical protein